MCLYWAEELLQGLEVTVASTWWLQIVHQPCVAFSDKNCVGFACAEIHCHVSMTESESTRELKLS